MLVLYYDKVDGSSYDIYYKNKAIAVGFDGTLYKSHETVSISNELLITKIFYFLFRS